MGVKNKENVSLYSVTANADSANGCNFDTNKLTLAPGQDPQGFAVGMRHVF
jgi:hypothetical protein